MFWAKSSENGAAGGSVGYLVWSAGHEIWTRPTIQPANPAPAASCQLSAPPSSCLPNDIPNETSGGSLSHRDGTGQPRGAGKGSHGLFHVPQHSSLISSSLLCWFDQETEPSPAWSYHWNISDSKESKGKTRLDQSGLPHHVTAHQSGLCTLRQLENPLTQKNCVFGRVLQEDKSNSQEEEVSSGSSVKKYSITSL